MMKYADGRNTFLFFPFWKKNRNRKSRKTTYPQGEKKWLGVDHAMFTVITFMLCVMLCPCIPHWRPYIDICKFTRHCGTHTHTHTTHTGFRIPTLPRFCSVPARVGAGAEYQNQTKRSFFNLSHHASFFSWGNELSKEVSRMCVKYQRINK